LNVAVILFRDLLFQMTYLMQCGPWCATDCLVKFAILAEGPYAQEKMRTQSVFFRGRQSCALFDQLNVFRP